MTATILCVIFGNAAFGLNVLSFWMTNVRWLRTLSICSSVCFVIYSTLVPGGPLWIMVGWSFVFMGINAYRLKVPPSRRGVATSAE